jgi:16S rRNA (guanine527-N7)-methyltransferase
MNIFTKNGINLSEKQLKQFEKLLEIFIEWNGKINLSAIRDREGVFEKHFVDSLLPTKFFNFNDKKILDLGAGGGFPTLPLGVFCKNSQITAVDSVGKKTKAMLDMATNLNLNIKTRNDRIETLGQDLGFREQFDVVTARALAPWATLLEYTLPFVKIGGYFIAYQGPAVIKDLEAYENLEMRLGGEIEQIHADKLGENERIFVVIKKIKPTPKKYPRAIGEPKKNPLKIKA